MSQLLLTMPARWLTSAAVPSVLAPLHRSDARRLVKNGVHQWRSSPVLQIDRTKLKYREEWGIRALFQCACAKYREVHGEMAPNDYSLEPQQMFEVTGPVTITFGGKTTVLQNATVVWDEGRK
jgi:hypothetical protein